MRGPRKLAFAAAVATLACGEARERPLPTGPDQTADLTVELLAPDHNQSATTGSTISVRVRGQEPNALLAGLGFYAVRLVAARPVVDSAFIGLTAARDTTLSFTFTVPDTMPHNAQLEIVGVALGPGLQRAISEARGLGIIRCGAGSIFC